MARLDPPRRSPPARALLALALGMALTCPTPAAAANWLRFGVDPARTNAYTGSTGIAGGDLAGLEAQSIDLEGVPDSSPVYLHGAKVAGATHDVFVVATSYGRTVALDGSTGAILWRFAPEGIETLEGAPAVTTASPVADPERRSVYTASPDGLIHRVRVEDGVEMRTARWPARVTHIPKRDKLSSALNLAGPYVIAVTAAYRDATPWQGHVVTLDRHSGRVAGVFNVVCADRHVILKRGQCPHFGGGIWGRGGVAVEPKTHRLLLATGNADWNRGLAYGDSLLELSRDARRLLGDWTPGNYHALERADLDLGSGSPALLRHRHRLVAVQVSKDGRARLFDVERLRTGLLPGHTPGLLDSVKVPGGEPFVSAPAVWQARHTVFLGDRVATFAYAIRGKRPHLKRLWRNDGAGTSPVLAGGLLYVFDYLRGELRVLDPATGVGLRTLPAAPGHWSSPVVAGGRILLGVGNANTRLTSGSVLMYGPPGG